MSSKKLSSIDQASYEKLLSDFNDAQASFERAKAAKNQAKQMIKDAGEDKDKHDLYILDKGYKKAKHKKKYKKHVLKIARKRLKDLRLPDYSEKSYSLADAEGASQQSPAGEQEHKLLKKEKKERLQDKKASKLKKKVDKSMKKASKSKLSSKKTGVEQPIIAHPDGKSKKKDARVDFVLSACPELSLQHKVSAVTETIAAESKAPLQAERIIPTTNRPVSERKATTIPGDLKQIGGIGPKIEELLKNHGINSIAQLARASAESVKECLIAGGNRYAIHDPQSWPQQAKLLHEGKMEEFNRLKAELKGGKVVKP